MRLNKLFIWIIIVILINAVLAVLLIYFETQVEGASINTIGDTLWYYLVTIASVGYGDKYPVSVIGKIIGSIFIIQGILFLSIIIGQFADLIKQHREKKKMGYFGTNFENHIIILGWDSFADSITEILIDANQKVGIITDNKDDVDILYDKFGKESIFILFTQYGNYSQFQNLNIQKSKLVLINLKNDTDKLVAILNLKQQYPNLKFMVTLEESKLKTTFEGAGVTYVISRDEIASKLIASYIFEPEVADFSIDILSHSQSEEDFDIQQFLVTDENPFVDKTYGELFDFIRANYRALLVGISKPEKGKYRTYRLPRNNIEIKRGDYLIFINNSVASNELSKIFKVNQGRI